MFFHDAPVEYTSNARTSKSDSCSTLYHGPFCSPVLHMYTDSFSICLSTAARLSLEMVVAIWSLLNAPAAPMLSIIASKPGTLPSLHSWCEWTTSICEFCVAPIVTIPSTVKNKRTSLYIFPLSVTKKGFTDVCTPYSQTHFWGTMLITVCEKYEAGDAYLQDIH